MMRCSMKSGLTSGPNEPFTVTVLPVRVMSPVTVAEDVVVDSLVPSGNLMVTTSPAWMSGVTFSAVPAPQQTPPGWLTSKATPLSDTRAWADPMTPTPGRDTSSVAVSPACAS